jgi:YfiH family protein
VLNEGQEMHPRADAAIATRPGRVCAVLTADCLPVVLADRAGTCVGVAHAGWRGLAAGIVQATVDALDRNPRDLVAWLGPAIGPTAFEVGAEVREAYLRRSPGMAACFEPNQRGRFLADLYGLARCVLAVAGVADVYGGCWCTVSDPVRFFSFRRDGATGRMATLAWLG